MHTSYFMAPDRKNWMRIYNKLKKYNTPVRGENPCFIFNSNALPNPDVIENYWSEFEIAMHWRYTVLWAREHGLKHIVEEAEYESTFFTDDNIYLPSDYDERFAIIDYIIQVHYTGDSEIFTRPKASGNNPYIIGAEYDVWRYATAAIVGVSGETDEDELLSLAAYCKDRMLIPVLLIDEYIDGRFHGATYNHLSYSYGDYHVPQPKEREYRDYIYRMIVNALYYNSTKMLLLFVPSVDNDHVESPWPLEEKYGIPFLTLLNQLTLIMNSGVTSDVNVEINCVDMLLTVYRTSRKPEDDDYTNSLVNVNITAGSKIVVWHFTQGNKKRMFLIELDFDDEDDSCKFIIAEKSI